MVRNSPAQTESYSLGSILTHWLSAVLVVGTLLHPRCRSWLRRIRLSRERRCDRGSLPPLACVASGPARTCQCAGAGGILQSPGKGLCTGPCSPSSWVVVASGYLLPWSLGHPLDVYGFQIPSPMEAHHGFHEIMEQVHDAAGHPLHTGPDTPRRGSGQARDLQPERIRTSHVQGGEGGAVGIARLPRRAPTKKIGGRTAEGQGLGRTRGASGCDQQRRPVQMAMRDRKLEASSSLNRRAPPHLLLRLVICTITIRNSASNRVRLHHRGHGASNADGQCISPSQTSWTPATMCCSSSGRLRSKRRTSRA